MFLQERLDVRRQHELPDTGVNVHSQPTAGLRRCGSRVDRRVFDRRQVRPDRLVKPAPLVGQRDRACGAMKDADADPFFEPRDCPTDGGLRQAERLAGSHETAGGDDRLQHSKPVQSAPVEPHQDDPQSCSEFRVCVFGRIDSSRKIM